jgi:protein-disulfide isomerase
MHIVTKSFARGFALAAIALAPAACKRNAAEQAQGPAAKAPGLDAPSVGANEPKVELIAFLDYQCPYSRAHAADLQAMAEKNKDSLRLRVVSMPLDVHAHSVSGAKAAVAAHKQRAYWKFYDKFLVQAAAAGDKAIAPSREAAIAWAVEAGLDAKRMAADIDAADTDKTVSRGVGLAKVFGVTGTPSFVINGQLVQGVQPAEYWTKKIAEEVARAEALLASGTRKDALVQAMVAATSPSTAGNWQKYVVKGEDPPATEVPAKVAGGGARSSGVASAQIQAAGGGMGAIQVGEPVQVGQDAVDPETVWRVAIRPDDPALGNLTAQVTLVVFEDMECPFCAKLQGTLKKLREAYPTQLRIVFKHNPLPFHKNAELAANALEAARQQGKFWELHDVLLANHNKLSEDAIKGHADALKLDRSKLDTLLAAKGGMDRIEADMEQAAALGARGTPNLFVNGKKFVGAKDESVLKPIIDAEIAAADKLLASGVKGTDLYESFIGRGKLLDSLASDQKQLAADVGAVRGPVGAAIHIVTFQDFQCPFSARLDPHIAEIEKEFEGRVKVSWVDFPLSDIHPMAQLYAEAGHEARKQGKFWKFHEVVMADNSKLDEAGLFERAKKAGLDTKALKAALDKHTHAEAVKNERALGDSLGVKGTPSVFVNGHAFVPQTGFSANTFRAAVRRMLGTR